MKLRTEIARVFVAVSLVFGLVPVPAFAVEEAAEVTELAVEQASVSEAEEAELDVPLSLGAVEPESNLDRLEVLDALSDELDPISAPHVEGEILVVFANDASEEGALGALSAAGVEERSAEGAVETTLEGSSVAVVELEEGVSVEAAIEMAERNPNVAYAQPNYEYYLLDNEVVSEDEAETRFAQYAEEESALEALASFVPNDPALRRTASSTAANAWHLATINAFEAWNVARANGNTTVAVVDTGCNMSHEDLTANLLANYAYDAVHETALTGDSSGHGTHVAGLVAAAANNGKGTAGSSYNAKILPVNVFDSTTNSCSTSTLVAAYDYLLNVASSHPELNLRVINLSLGAYTDGRSNDDLALHSRIAAAEAAGIATVCSAGNGDASGNPMTSTNLPSDYEECISVTALAVNGQPLSWCDYNSAKDICVPGELLYSTSNVGSSSYEFMSGTSMAAPVCSGVLALMWAANPSLTVAEAKAALYETAAPLTVPAGREGLYGHGVLDAAAAVTQACGYASAPMADPYVSTGIGSGKIRTAPYGSWYKRSGVQMLYTASELGNKANIITGLAFNVIAPASFTSTDVKVYLGHTSKNVFGSAADAVSADNLTLVYSGALTVGQERGWEELKLDKSFAYNGTDNLVVAVFHSSAAYNGSLYYTCSTKPGMILSRGNDSSSEFVSVDYLGNYVVNSERPDLRLHVLLPGEELDAPLFTEVAAPTGATLSYNGFEQIGVSEGEGYTLSGVTSATAAGTYEAVATLRSTYIWEDGSQDPRVIRWSIQAPEVRDTEVQVGTQIGADYHAPYCNYYRFSGSQTIYTADEIGKAGSIDSLAFFVTNATAYSTYSVRVYLGHTKKAAFESGSEALAESDLTLVYAGTPTLGQAVGWERLNFDTAFNYNGTDNLAVVVYHISTEFTSALRYAKTEGVCLTRQSDTVESYAKVEDGSNYSVKDGRPLALLNMDPLVETDPGDGVEPGDGDGVGNPDSGNQDGSGSANPPVVTTPGGGQTQPGDSGDATPDEGGSVQVQVGVQTSSTFDVPYAGFFCYGASQSIYTASEIGRAGLIESLGFLVTVASPLTTTEVKVYLGHTRKDGFTSANAPLSLADVSLVYTGHPTLGQSTGWEEMTLDEPFAYNGVDNLAVVVCRASDDWNGELQYGACAGSCIYRFDDGDDSILNMANSDSYSLDTSQRPMISLAMTDLPEDAFGQNVPGDLSVVEYGIGLQLVVFEPTVPLASGCPVWHGSNMWWNGREQCWMLVAAEESGLAALEAGVSLNATGDQCAFALPGSAVAGQVVGDLNDSGSMSIVDAQLCYNIACGSFGSLDLGVNQSTFLMADVNGDHYVDAADALALQHAIHCGW